VRAVSTLKYEAEHCSYSTLYT